MPNRRRHSSTKRSKTRKRNTLKSPSLRRRRSKRSYRSAKLSSRYRALDRLPGDLLESLLSDDYNFVPTSKRISYNGRVMHDQVHTFVMTLYDVDVDTFLSNLPDTIKNSWRLSDPSQLGNGEVRQISATRNTGANSTIHDFKRAIKTALVNSSPNTRITVVDNDTTMYNPNPHLGLITELRLREGILDTVLGNFQVYQVELTSPNTISKRISQRIP